MLTYLSVGTAKILPELFKPIKNGNPKPTGGIWATKQNLDLLNYNDWVDFLSWNPSILFYKSKSENPFIIPAVLITLNENAKVFNLGTKADLEYLKETFKTEDNWIDFEKMSLIYDAIYVNLESLYREVGNDEQNKLKQYAVSSLILFNLNCIDYYRSATVEIEPYDYELFNKFTNYSIVIEKTPTRTRVFN